MRIQNLELRIKNCLVAVVFSFYILHSLFLIPTVLALESSQSSVLKEKIDALKKEIASKAAQLKQDVNKKMQNKAVAGQILEKTDSRLILQTLKGHKTINLNEYTEYKSAKKKALALKNLDKGNYVVALGDIDDKNVLTAKRVVLLDKAPVESQIIWGQIDSVNNPNIIINTKDTTKITISTTGDTTFKLGNEDSSIIDAKLKRFLVVVGTLKNTTLSADYIYLIPQVGFYKPEKPKVATPSASASATPKKK